MSASDRSLKFAVVREDPELELTIARSIGARCALTVASGGCTALTLSAAGLEVTAFDTNRAQLDHVEAKRQAVRQGDLSALNVQNSSPAALNQRGAFEGLFRLLRGAFTEFVLSAAETERWFDSDAPIEGAPPGVEAWFGSQYWQACFSTAFNEGLLHAMFGTAATQHAPRGSYPCYFQRAFERGLRRPGAARNPFLQHIFLGHYRERDAPAYVRAGRDLAVELVHGTVHDVKRLECFQLYSLSNVFDWADDGVAASWGRTLQQEARSGSAVLIRQLNNQRDVRRFFEPAFAFHEHLGRELLEQDRSLFYERIEVGIKR